MFQNVHRTRAGAAAALCLALAAGTAGAGEPAPFSPLDFLDLARDAAEAWEPDARLIYLENDEALTPEGRSVRWGYLFHSPAADQARCYSIRDGKIVAASDLPFRFEAPPLTGGWIDPGAALRAAEEKAGAKYREESGGLPTTLFLARGGFDEDRPDRTTWTVVYTSPSGPSLFVLVDAIEGKVRKTWKG